MKRLIVTTIVSTFSFMAFGQTPEGGHLILNPAVANQISALQCQILATKSLQDEKELQKNFQLGNLDQASFESQQKADEAIRANLLSPNIAPTEKLKDSNLSPGLSNFKKQLMKIESVPDPTLKGDGPEVPGLRPAMVAYPSNPHPISPTDVSFPFLCGISRSSDVNGSQVVASCFYLTNGYFATALHVFDNESGLYVFSSQRASADIVPKYIFRIDETSLLKDVSKDLCLFRTYPSDDGTFASAVFQSPACTDADNFPVLTHLKIVGFPRGSYEPINSNCIFVGFLHQWDSTRGDVLGMGATWQGFSGAPLMTADGSVIGIMRWQASQQDVNSDGSSVLFAPTADNAFGAISIRRAFDLLKPGGSSSL